MGKVSTTVIKLIKRLLLTIIDDEMKCGYRRLWSKMSFSANHYEQLPSVVSVIIYSTGLVCIGYCTISGKINEEMVDTTRRSRFTSKMDNSWDLSLNFVTNSIQRILYFS